MRGHIRKRYKGSWSVVIDTKDAAGKRERTWITVEGEEGKCRSKAHGATPATGINTYVDTSKLTVGEWLTQWLAVAKSEMRPATVSRYQSILDGRLLKAPIASMLVQKLRSIDIETYYTIRKSHAQRSP